MLSIVIPNYNKFDLIEKCIKSIQLTKDILFEIIVVDNGSTDGSLELIATKYPFVNLIQLPENLGFSKAVNMGIKQAKGDYIAILNNDTELATGWVENIIKAFEQNKDLLFTTSKIKSLHHKTLFDDVGDIILPSGKVYKLGHNEKDTGQYDQQRYVFGASGCASVYRREFFEKIGYFDEDFFAYLEDIDLSFRAILMGYKCLYVPDAVVYHMGSATTGSMYNKFTVFHLAQNTINVIVKNYPAKILLRTIFSILWHIASLQAFFLTKSFGMDFFRGLVSGIGMIKKMLPKRREIMKNRVISDKELIELFKANKKLYKISRKRREK